MNATVATTPPTDPTLAVAERQLAMLGELAALGMAAARASSAAVVASAKAEEAILADEYFQPEIGRARACGAKDAAASFQKVSRAVRLTLKLEMAVAEIVRDIRAGVVTHSNAGVLASPWSRDRDRNCERRASDAESLVEFDHPDAFLRASFHEAVEEISMDIEAEVDWTNWKVRASPSPNSVLPDGSEAQRSDDPGPVPETLRQQPRMGPGSLLRYASLSPGMTSFSSTR